MNKLTITNTTGATARTGPSTAGGIIRSVRLGETYEYINTLKSPSGDIWAQLAEIDPSTQRPWVFAKKETFAFVAVYVGTTEYAKLTPGTPTDGGETYADGFRAGYGKRTNEVVAFLSRGG